jgi:hypothetical protein
MKTIADVIREAPKKDKITVSFINKYNIVDEVVLTEEQFRYLQICIAKGEFPLEGTCVIAKDGRKIPFASDGRLTDKDLNNNCLSLNDNLAIKLLYFKAGK